MKEEYIYDLEGDSLVDNITKIHCLCYCKVSNPDNIVALTDYEDMRKFFLNENIVRIGHNIILYDEIVAKKILRITPNDNTIDTLPIAWYLEPTTRNKYSLESYGEEFGVEKPKIEDWNNLKIEDYIHRCTEDVKINTILWKKQLNHLRMIYGDIDLVHRFINYIRFKMYCVQEQEELGLALDVKHCEEMIDKLSKEKEDKMSVLREAMPKVPIFRTKTYPTNMYRKDGTLSIQGDKWYALLKQQNLPDNYNQPVKYIDGYEEPTPTSQKQIKDWLYSLGWIPENIKHLRNKEDNSVKKIPQIASKQGQGEICESIHKLFNKEPKLELLSGLSVLSHRISIFKGFLNDHKDGRLYATMAGLTNTLRLKHAVIVNLPGLDKRYGKEIRSSIIADESCVLLGSDLKNIEANTRNHYIYPYDKKYVEEMSVEGFDSHLDIAVLAGMLTPEQAQAHKDGKEKYNAIRQKAKIVNFSALYGVGVPTLARNSGMTEKEAKKLLDTYWERNKSVLEFSKSCERKFVGKQQWVKNPINSFWYSLRSDKDIFSTVNQSSAQYCLDIFIHFLKALGLKVPFQYHDEILLNVKKGDEQKTKDIINKAIEMTNNKLKLNIQVACSVEFGNTYASCH